MKLTRAERDNPVWAKLRAHLEAKLDIERKRNDAPTHTELETQRIRGRISLIKELLALDRDGSAVEGGSEDLP